MRSRTKLIVFALVACALMQVLIFYKLRYAVAKGYPDFLAFHAAGKIVLAGKGSSLYDFNLQRAAQAEWTPKADIRTAPLFYPHAPFETLIYVPLALLSFPAAFTVWFAIDLAILLMLPLLMVRRLPHLAPYAHWVVIGVSAFFPSVVCLMQGQDSVLSLLILVVSLGLLRKHSDLAAGMVLALGTFKLQLVLPIFLALLFLRRWRALAGFIQMGMALVVISIFIVGWHGLVSYPRFLREYSHMPYDLSNAYPQLMTNLRGFVTATFQTIFSQAAMDAIIAAGSAAILVVLFYVCNRAKKSPESFDLVFSLAISTTVIVAYHFYTHDLIVMLLPIMVVLDRIMATPKRSSSLLLAGISACLVFIAPYMGMNTRLNFLTVLAFFCVLTWHVLAGSGQPTCEAQALTRAANQADYVPK